MSHIAGSRYSVAEPGCGLTVFSMEGGEITLFGSCVKIKTTGQDSYDTIEDAPKDRPVVDQAEANLFNGLKVSSFFAVLGSVALFGATIAAGGTAAAASAGAVDNLISVIPQIVGIEAAAEMLAQMGKATMGKPPDGGDAAEGEEEGVYIENGEKAPEEINFEPKQLGKKW